jgi:excisionase family DNA binding protein
MSGGQGDEVLTVREVAQRLKLTGETVRRWLRDGKLRGVRFSDAGGWRVRASEVERVLLGGVDPTPPSGDQEHGQLRVAEAPARYDTSGDTTSRQGKAAAA